MKGLIRAAIKGMKGSAQVVKKGLCEHHFVLKGRVPDGNQAVKFLYTYECTRCGAETVESEPLL